MKKAAGIISLLIVLSMILLSFSACGKKVPLSERLDEAMQKMADSKVFDYELTGKMVVSAEGVTIDAPMTASMKTDMRDENNPKSSMDIKFILMDQDFSVKSCTVDGIFYLDTMGTKVKSPVSENSEEDFEKQTGMSVTDFQKIFVETYKIENAEIKEEKDGSFKAKFFVGAESDLSKTIASVFEAIAGTYAAEIGDVIVEFNIDKNNTVVSGFLNMSVKVNIENLKMDYNMTFDIVHNPVGDDFKIEAPADADSYVYSFDS